MENEKRKMERFEAQLKVNTIQQLWMLENMADETKKEKIRKLIYALQELG